MALKKSIDQPMEPPGRPTTLKGLPANEFAFESSGQAQVSVKVVEGFKAASKTLPGDLAPGGGFTPDRIVINLGMKTQSGAAATRFSTPFELRIRYTGEDVSTAGGNDKLKLAYWSDNRWNVFTSSDHKFKVESSDMLFVELSSWPADPPIAVGH